MLSLLFVNILSNKFIFRALLLGFECTPLLVANMKSPNKRKGAKLTEVIKSASSNSPDVPYKKIP